MTRGTFAFISDASEHPDIDPAMLLSVSEEYNGDMGPDMMNGIKFGGKLFRDVESFYGFIDHCRKASVEFGYVEDTDDEMKKWSGYLQERMSFHLLCGNSKDNPFVMVHIVNKNGIQDYDKNPYSTIFHYSDYVYMKNMSSHPAFFKDADRKVFCLAPAQSKVLCFGHQIDESEWEQFCREMNFRFGKEEGNG